MKNFPKVDDGKIYPEIRKFIQNENFIFDLNKLLSVDKVMSLSNNSTFFKIADCVLNLKENFPNSYRSFIDGKNYDGKLVDYKPLDEYQDLWKMKEKEWLYLIAYCGKVVKIGMTSSGLQSRYGSYNCGTKKAMLKGSCATTNFVITQANYLAKLKDLNVEIFVHEIPENWTEIEIFGRKQRVLNKIAHKYESTLIDLYYKEVGFIPPLCSAFGSVE